MYYIDLTLEVVIFYGNPNLLNMSKLRKDIDNKNLFDILNKAVQVDKMYWIQNDAKIRASYTSQNYDEFR